MDRTASQQSLRHPKGLYVLFASEAWERFSFYSMLSMFTLYLRDTAQGFGWTEAEATSLYSWYLTLVYASPFIGGLLADRYLGYLRTTLIGAVFFVAGHFLLSFHSINIVDAALACLIVGNGLFKPNVSTMVREPLSGRQPSKGPRIRDLLLRDQRRGIRCAGHHGGGQGHGPAITRPSPSRESEW